MITDIKWSPTHQQSIAWDYLHDSEHTEILYGGGAAGGKSLLGCAWLLFSCLEYAGTRWLMGRAELGALKQSTLLTFFDLCSKCGLKSDVDFHYAGQGSSIKFMNGSEVFLKDLKAQPSDPNFDTLGSTEYTGAFIDEASEVTVKAKNIVMSRLRYRLTEYKLVPKLLVCSNPAKNWMYIEFYKPWKENKLLSFRAFIPAKVQDNPHISPHYLENLKKLDENSKQRLLFGNWEYDNDSSRLFDYPKLVDMFSITHAVRGKKYISVDVARFGKDTTTVYVWDGLMLTHVYVYTKMSTTDNSKKVDELAHNHQVSRSRIVVDEDGVGGGVVDQLNGCYGFVNNSKALSETGNLVNYANLKTQCAFKLAQLVSEGKIGIIPQEFRDVLIAELEQVKRKNSNSDDQKVRVVDKETMKENLGRSPDHADAMMMRMIFEITSQEFAFLEDKKGLVL